MTPLRSNSAPSVAGNADVPRDGRRRRSVLGNRTAFAYGLMAAPLLIVTVLLLVPTFYTAWLSLQDHSLTSPRPAEFIGLDNFAEIATNPMWRDSIVRTVAFVLISVGVQFIVGFAIALLLAKYLSDMKFLRTVLLIPFMVSEVVVGLSWRLMLQYDGGIVNSTLEFLGLPPVYWLGPDMAFTSVVIADAWQNIPFVILIIYAALQVVPRDVREASVIDGANAWQRLRHVIVPLIMPSILVVLMFRMIFAIRTFGTVWLLTEGGPGRATSLISIDVYNLAFRSYDLGLGAAMSFCLLIISGFITVLYMRWLNRDPY